jgi:hypothetical protein
MPMGDRERWLILIPGVGPITVRWPPNALGDVSRFPDGAPASSQFGLVPPERTSRTAPRRGRINIREMIGR